MSIEDSDPAQVRVDLLGPVLIVGTGLIGTSVALALRRAGVPVLLSDTDPTALSQAALRCADTAPGPWLPPRLVVVATPPGVAAEAIAAALDEHPQATVTDVTSVKGRVVTGVDERGGDPARFVGGHPMAGREITGPAAATADLFEDRPWVVTPTESSDPDAVALVRDLALVCGAVPVVMTPGEHDRAVALTSHTPQILSSLLAARLLAAQPAEVAVSGQGLRDLTRIAGSDAELWTQILTANAGPVADVLSALAADLAAVVQTLRVAESATGFPAGAESRALATPLREALVRGNLGRNRLPGKHGAAQAPYAIVPVMIADRPGELGRLFVAAGEADANLEDVRIEHVLGRPTGLVELSVRPEQARSLAQVLRVRGFAVRS